MIESRGCNEEDFGKTAVVQTFFDGKGVSLSFLQRLRIQNNSSVSIDQGVLLSITRYSQRGSDRG